MNFNPAIQFAWHVNTALIALVIVRLFSLRLHNRFPWFLAFRLLSFAVGLAGFFLDPKSRDYCYLYLSLTPFYLVLYVLMVGEVFKELNEKYPGLRNLARGSLAASAVLGIGTALAAVPITSPKWACADFQCRMFVFVEFQRGAMLGLAVLMLSMLWRLSRFPISISRNTWNHACILSALLCIGVASQLYVLLNHNERSFAITNVLLMAASVGCNLMWLAFMKREDPAMELSVRPRPAAVAAMEQALLRFDEVLIDLITRYRRRV